MHHSFVAALAFSFATPSCCFQDPRLLPLSGSGSQSARLYPFRRGGHIPYYKYWSSFGLSEPFTRTSLLSTPNFAVPTAPKIVNVNDYGAVGDGRDDSQAFRRTWNAACTTGSAALVVPSGRTYRLKPIRFSGPCKPSLVFEVYGTIQASNNMADYADDEAHWLMFENLDNFRVEGGGGSTDGNGKTWWENSCETNPILPCRAAPTASTFHGCNNLWVPDLSLKNAQQMHLLFEDCTSVQAVNLSIIAPEESPNTDGIHVSRTQNIVIQNCVLGQVSNCNFNSGWIDKCPSHGYKPWTRSWDKVGNSYQTSDLLGCRTLCIGSLGAGDSQDYVSDVLVTKARLSGTTNGVRIKTWLGGSGHAKNIKFQDIVMNNVKNPIIIDQNYCDQTKNCQTQASAVQVSNVVYSDIRGTSAAEEAIIFYCSKSHPCQGITLQDINLRSSKSSGNRAAEALCSNVNFIQSEGVFPQCTKITS